MKDKIKSFPLLLLLAVFLASLYGAVHNQISYSVSPGYFHEFKFLQFGFSENLQNRLGASLIGILATWWMGLFVAIPIGIATIFAPSAAEMRVLFIRTSLIILVLTLLVGLGALLYGLVLFSDEHLPIWMTGRNVSDPVRFATAGNMHNHSYLGGLIGVVVGLAYVLWTIRRQRGRILAFNTD